MKIGNEPTARISPVFRAGTREYFLNIETETGDGQLHSLVFLGGNKESADQVIAETVEKLKSDLVDQGYTVNELTAENLEPIQAFLHLPASTYVSL